MRFYQKYFAGNYEELISYYPRFYRDVLEMRAILEAHGAVADRLEADIERAYLNSFVDYADESTLLGWEKLLAIKPDRERTLEERRRLVKSFLIGFGKISASTIIQMVKSYTNGDAEARLEPSDEAGNNTLYLDLAFCDLGATEIHDIFYMLEKRIPAHIKWRVTFLSEPLNVCVGVGASPQIYRQVQSEAASAETE